MHIPRGGGQTLSFYRSLPNVVYAEPNYVADQHGLAAPNDSWWSQQWGLQKIDALAGWDIYPDSCAAAGAPIAIVDSGIDASHPDLAGQVAPGANCLTGMCVAGGITIDDNGATTILTVTARQGSYVHRAPLVVTVM